MQRICPVNTGVMIFYSKSILKNMYIRGVMLWIMFGLLGKNPIRNHIMYRNEQMH